MIEQNFYFFYKSRFIRPSGHRSNNSHNLELVTSVNAIFEVISNNHKGIQKYLIPPGNRKTQRLLMLLPIFTTEDNAHIKSL